MNIEGQKKTTLDYSLSLLQCDRTMKPELTGHLTPCMQTKVCHRNTDWLKDEI